MKSRATLATLAPAALDYAARLLPTVTYLPACPPPSLCCPGTSRDANAYLSSLVSGSASRGYIPLECPRHARRNRSRLLGLRWLGLWRQCRQLVEMHAQMKDMDPFHDPRRSIEGTYLSTGTPFLSLTQDAIRDFLGGIGCLTRQYANCRRGAVKKKPDCISVRERPVTSYIVPCQDHRPPGCANRMGLTTPSCLFSRANSLGVTSANHIAS